MPYVLEPGEQFDHIRGQNFIIMAKGTTKGAADAFVLRRPLHSEKASFSIYMPLG